MSVRRIEPRDVPNAVTLMVELGYPTTAGALGERIAAVTSNPGDAVLIAEEAGEVLGLVALHSFEMLHRAGRLGRITALVVAENARRRGVGGKLLRAAESQLLSIGCTMLEVTSAEQRRDAHDFYAAHGYREYRARFIKNPAA
jgi:GNAT superfamily N-acetyltransferase